MYSRYKRIIYKGIWVASLPFLSVLATCILTELNQLPLVTRTHCIANQRAGNALRKRRSLGLHWAPVGPEGSPTVSRLVGGWAQRAVRWGTSTVRTVADNVAQETTAGERLGPDANGEPALAGSLPGRHACYFYYSEDRIRIRGGPSTWRVQSATLIALSSNKTATAVATVRRSPTRHRGNCDQFVKEWCPVNRQSPYSAESVV